MKITNIKPGDTVYDLQRHKMGNTTISTLSCYEIKIYEVDHYNGWVVASWNNNSKKKYHTGSISRWKKNKPVMVHTRLGYSRLATKEEKKAMKDGQAKV